MTASRNTTYIWLLEWPLAIILIAAAIGKLADYPNWQKLVMRMGVSPDALALIAAALLVSLEIVSGLMLVAKLGNRIVYLVGCGLGAAFCCFHLLKAIFPAHFLAKSGCGCFGATLQDRGDIFSILSAGFLLIGFSYLLYQTRSNAISR